MWVMFAKQDDGLANVAMLNVENLNRYDFSGKSFCFFNFLSIFEVGHILQGQRFKK
jgi:hypothetical protein